MDSDIRDVPTWLFILASLGFVFTLIRFALWVRAMRAMVNELKRCKYRLPPPGTIIRDHTGKPAAIAAGSCNMRLPERK